MAELMPWVTPDALPVAKEIGEVVFVVQPPSFTEGVVWVWTGEQWAAVTDVDRRQVVEDMTQEVWDFLGDKGWLDTDHSFSELMVLLHTEISEAVEAYRQWGLETPPTRLVSYAPDGAYPGAVDIVKPEGVGPEMADLLVRLLHTCRRLNVDLVEEFRRVMEHNRQRPFRHGKKKM